MPALFDKGIRYYINIKLDINENLTLWTRFAQTIYNGKESIGSGADEISGNTKSEGRLQIVYVL
jgi:hypothetical protein